MPSHIAGAMAGSASRLEIRVVVESASKWKAIKGAVASVAAIVTAAPSARAPRQPRAPTRRASAVRSGLARARMPSTAAKLSCQPTSAAMPGSIAAVTAAATTSAWSRDPRRPASVASTPRAPIRPARTIDGPPPTSGT